MYAHKFLMVLTAALLIYAVSKAYARGENWFAQHQKFATLGVTFGLFGFAAMVVFKLGMGYPHFKSLHSLAGLIAVLSFTGAPLAGKLLVSGKKSLRTMHIMGGRFAVLVAIISVIIEVIH